jgi:hypothetical protein
MSEERYVTGIRLDYGSMKIIFRDAREIKVKNNILRFITAVTCLGNNTDEDGQIVWTQFAPWVHSGLEGIIPNPVYIRYNLIRPQHTAITVYLEHTEGYEIIPGY